MVSTNESNRDSKKARAARKTILVVVLVAEDVVDPADTSDHARKRERPHPDSADADATVLRRRWLEPDRAKLVPAARAKEIEPHRECDQHSHDQREIGGRSVESRIDVREPGQHTGVDLRSVQGLRYVQVPRDEPVEQRQHDEVEHDRDDDFVRAEPGLEIRRNRSNDSTREPGGNHANEKREDERRADRERESHESGAEPPRGELALSSDVEQSGAQTERNRQAREGESRRLVQNLSL